MKQDRRVAKLDFETATKLGKLICSADYELMATKDCLSVDAVSEQIGIDKITVKRWIAECVFVDSVPIRTFVTDEFPEGQVEPYEVLAYYVGQRLHATQYYRVWNTDEEE